MRSKPKTLENMSGDLTKHLQEPAYVARLEKAMIRYFYICGPAAEQPKRQISTVSRNGTSFLKNMNGLLAVVTSTGAVFSYIGGLRQDRWPPSKQT